MPTEKGVFEESATIESWDEDYYHPIAERFYDEAVPTMLKLMEAVPGARILDAGCGPGVHSVRAARAGFRVCAIDLSEAMLKEARRRVSDSGTSPDVEFAHEDLTHLSFHDSSFRYIFSWGVIIHIPDAEAALSELARVLEPGGMLALYITNGSAWDHKFESLVRRVIGRPMTAVTHHRLGVGTEYEMHGQSLWLWKFDVEQVRALLESRGLHLKHRVIGEFSEIQRRVRGPLRRALLHLNNLAFRLNWSPRFGVTNLLIFRKAD